MINYLPVLKRPTIPTLYLRALIFLTILWSANARASISKDPKLLITVSEQKEINELFLTVPKKSINLADSLIQGIVLDSLQKPIPGVSVLVKNNPSNGTSTDLNGRYSLKVPNNAIIIFKMVGYAEIAVPANKPEINIVLREDKSTLNEVQIVAFGTQKKESVVGAITTIKPEQLKVPSSNLTTALSGRVAGVIAFQRSGEPGADNANFFVREQHLLALKENH
ncbi:carboxypeptidase-like regulatory domain-containing protein [Pedobacter nyackensis]|uniref:carboxypeptidase-like regulatory domain-containing protein n=1 Tax=Pedobacter nyackensis TaxID=475255 RepID=UPI002931ED30|nr:carboxypeptidase-like regulatory domain-containing protein [Pedobacter nyackensis]